MVKIFQNIILGISLAATFGPASLIILKTGLKSGFKSAFKVTLGVVSADLLFLTVIFLGLKNFINLPNVRLIIYLLGTLVLFYFGYKTIKNSAKEIKLNNSVFYKSSNFFLEGLIVNLTNPLAIIWWLGVFGSILAESINHNPLFIEFLLNSTVLVGILIWHTVLSIISSTFKKIIQPKIIRIISLASGLILILFAINFLFKALTLPALAMFDSNCSRTDYLESQSLRIVEGNIDQIYCLDQECLAVLSVTKNLKGSGNNKIYLKNINVESDGSLTKNTEGSPQFKTGEKVKVYLKAAEKIDNYNLVCGELGKQIISEAKVVSPILKKHTITGYLKTFLEKLSLIRISIMKKFKL